MKKTLAKVAAYAVVVILLLLATKCDHGVKITTPQRDAKRIADLAENVESEADLRAVEKLATQYELAYRNSINGATAMKFKRLAEPALIAAGERRDAFREAEDYLLAQQTQLYDKLDLMDAAWQLTLTTAEEQLTEIDANNESIDEVKLTVAELIAKKEQLGFEVVDKGYPEDLLAEIGKVEDEISANEKRITELQRSNAIIEYAYKLQQGVDIYSLAAPETTTIEEVVLETDATEEAVLETNATDVEADDME